MLSLNCEDVHNVSSYYKALLNRFNSDKCGTFSGNNYCYLTTTIIIVFSSPGKINVSIKLINSIDSSARICCWLRIYTVMQVVSLWFCKDKYGMWEKQKGMRYIFFSYWILFSLLVRFSPLNYHTRWLLCKLWKCFSVRIVYDPHENLSFEF